jgi:phosphoglycolate phosphatase
VKLAVFDLDGTLVDSRRDLAEAANELLAACGGTPLPEEAVGRMVGDGAAALVARVFAAGRCAAPSDALVRFLEIYNGRLLRFTRPYPGIADALEAIGSRAAMAILTNKPLAATLHILRGLDLARNFPPGAVLGGDGPLPRKPDPAGLFALMAGAGVLASETTLIGDSGVDLRTAKAAGVRVCVARYGFGFDGFPIGELRPGDLVVDRPSDLPEQL